MIACIIQARMGSTRLPGKVLYPLDGKPIICHVIDRCLRIRGINKVILAMPALDMNGPLVEWAQSYGVRVRFGLEHDLVWRYLDTASSNNVDTIMRITGDCPLLNPPVCSRVLSEFLLGDYDYVSNVVERTYPDGWDCEVFSKETLEKVNSLATLPQDREHVTKYILEHPDEFKIGSVTQTRDDSHIRLTLDTREDYEHIKEVYQKYRVA